MRRLGGWKTAAFVAVGLVAYSVGLRLAGDAWDLPAVDVVGWVLLAAALVAQFGAKWAFGLLFREGVHRSDGDLSPWVAFRAALVGSGVARLVPAGGAFTPAAMAWSVRNEVEGTAGAAVRATLLNYGGLLVGTGAAVVWVRVRGLHAALTAGAVTAGALGILTGGLLLFGSGWMGTIGDRLPGRLRRRLGPTMRNEPVGLRDLALLAARLLLEASALGLAMAALGVRLTPTQTLAAFGLSQLIGGLPGLPGGLGVVEASLVGILAAFGFPPSATVAPVLVYRIVGYWIPAGASLLAGGASFADTAAAHQEPG